MRIYLAERDSDGDLFIRTNTPLKTGTMIRYKSLMFTVLNQWEVNSKGINPVFIGFWKNNSYFKPLSGFDMTGYQTRTDETVLPSYMKGVTGVDSPMNKEIKWEEFKTKFSQVKENLTPFYHIKN